MTLPRISDPVAADIAALYRRSLLATWDFSRSELDALLAVAKQFNALDDAGVRVDWLRAQLAYALFFDNSTRTKSAWAGAAARLGMQPVIIDGETTQVAHGETIAETGAMLGMNAHAMGVRHDLILGEGRRFMKEIKRGIDEYLGAIGSERSVPIVNLQCDLDHPTQTLADAMWLQEQYGDLRGKKVTVSWAYSPSYAKPLSVPQGLIMLLPRLGAHVTLAHPEGYELQPECVSYAHESAAANDGSFAVTNDMDAAFADAHVVYPKSWGPVALMEERVAAAGNRPAMADIEKRALAQNAAHRDWICDERRMALTHNQEALYMHCLPADIGAEVSPGVMDKYRVHVAREAQKKVYIIMALLAVAKVEGLAERLNTAGEA